MNGEDAALRSVIEVICRVLGIAERAASFDRDTPLLDAVPELDSMAIAQLILALEDRFQIDFEPDEITGEIFETVGTLTDFVVRRGG